MRLYTCIDPHRLKKVLDDKGIEPLKFARKVGIPSNRFMSYLSKAYKYPDFNEIKNIAEGLAQANPVNSASYLASKNVYDGKLSELQQLQEA